MLIAHQYFISKKNRRCLIFLMVRTKQDFQFIYIDLSFAGEKQFMTNNDNFNYINVPLFCQNFQYHFGILLIFSQKLHE